MQIRFDLTQDVFRIDAPRWCREIEEFIREYFSASHRDGIVVAVSGGLDSSVTAALCAAAIGKAKVTGLMLPERFGNPEASRYSRMIIRHLGIKSRRISISPILRGLGASDLILSAISGREFWKDTVLKTMRRQGHTTKGDYLDTLRGKLDPNRRRLIAKISSRQRARVLAAYRFAEENNCIVAGSAHKTEQMAGLFCKYGIDDCADVMPLKNVYRSQILQLAGCLGIPSQTLHRSPNPDILPGITDKYLGYFGMDCQKVDLILYGLEEGYPTSLIAGQTGTTERQVSEIGEIVKLSEHMRSHALAPILKP